MYVIRMSFWTEVSGKRINLNVVLYVMYPSLVQNVTQI